MALGVWVMSELCGVIVRLPRRRNLKLVNFRQKVGLGDSGQVQLALFGEMDLEMRDEISNLGSGELLYAIGVTVLVERPFWRMRTA